MIRFCSCICVFDVIVFDAGETSNCTGEGERCVEAAG